MNNRGTYGNLLLVVGAGVLLAAFIAGGNLFVLLRARAASRPPGPFALQVAPAGNSLTPGTKLQFHALRGFFRSQGAPGFAEDVTSRAIWSSSDTSIAQVSSSGLVAAQSRLGVVTITAVLGPLKASATLTVSTTVVLNSIAVAPANLRVLAGAAPITYTATGSYSDGAMKDVSGTASWSSSSTAVATMSNNVATVAGAGSAAISATVTPVTGSTGLTVVPKLVVSPANPSITFAQVQQFSANLPVSWSVDGISGGNSTIGAISPAGLYTPSSASIGAHTITAAGNTPPAQNASATIQVSSGFAGVLTYHNDNARTGLNAAEVVLNPTNVNSTQFGLLRFLQVDGKVDAQPLYVPSLTISGATHNVLVVATEHDSVYAWDPDTGTLLWKQTMLQAGETPSDDRGCSQVTPEIGVTATPVIDLQSGAHGTVYVVAMSKDAGGNYFQRLHALDLTTGADQVSPVTISAKFPGSGDNSQGGFVVFDPAQYKERPGLLLLNGVIYTAWSSHCDFRPYTSWVMAFDEKTLQQTSVLNLTPNGNEGAFWNSGAGLAADSGGFIYQLAGNGTFDTQLNANGFPAQGDFGNSFLKLRAGPSLAVADYFAMSNTVAESDADLDLGSGGALVLPDLTDAGGNTRHLAIGAGKDGNIYLVDRDNLGKFNPNNDSAIYQELDGLLGDGSGGGGIFSMPAYFNGRVYFGEVGDVLRAFQFSQARLAAAAVSATANSFSYPGTTPSISAANNSNGIVWAAENSDPATLHAYDANDLSRELYNSNQAGARDQFGSGNKFITPTIANGKVFLGTTDRVGVFGLLSAGARRRPKAAGPRKPRAPRRSL